MSIIGTHRTQRDYNVYTLEDTNTNSLLTVTTLRTVDLTKLFNYVSGYLDLLELPQILVPECTVTKQFNCTYLQVSPYQYSVTIEGTFQHHSTQLLAIIHSCVNL